MTTRRTYISILDADYKEAKKKAKEHGLSFSALVRFALKKIPPLKK